MTVSPNAGFKYSLGESPIVKVENIAPNATRHEIVKLFTALIGDVQSCIELNDGGKRRYFELEFTDMDAAKKALCMSGYNVLGVPMTVSSASSAEASRQPKQHRLGDGRRNLYVLGLPFDLTKSEFVEVFSQYGMVSHAVILATVDNASRRRGFIVMSTHKEAKIAMESLSRKEIKGHVIDVSWAVVQRSQGFLDGGDRTMVLSQTAVASSNAGPAFECSSVDPLVVEPPNLVLPILDSQPQKPALAPYSTSTLLVANLPTVFFSQPGDLQPLLRPYGDIVNLKIIPDQSSGDQGLTSVLIEYKTVTQAAEARDALSGQYYGKKPIKVEFVHPDQSSPVESDCSCWSTPHQDTKSGLNPFATPFFVNNPRSSSSFVNVSREGPPGLASENYPCGSGSSLVDHSAFLAHTVFRSCFTPIAGLYAPQFATHRPHSAPSQQYNPASIAQGGPTTCSSNDLHSFSATTIRSSFAT